MIKIKSLTMLCVLMTGVAIASEEAQTTVQVRWSGDAHGGTEARRGMREVPVERTACSDSFSLSWISTWLIEETSKSGVVDFRSGIEFTVKKLVEGRLVYPEITVIQSTSDGTVPVTFSFADTPSVGSEGWMSANRDFKERFDRMGVGDPDDWVGIRLDCRDPDAPVAPE